MAEVKDRETLISLPVRGTAAMQEANFVAASLLEEDGFEPSVPLGREVLDRSNISTGWVLLHGGTEGSNPSSSSGESGGRPYHGPHPCRGSLFTALEGALIRPVERQVESGTARRREYERLAAFRVSATRPPSSPTLWTISALISFSVQIRTVGNARGKGAIGQPEAFLDNKKRKKRAKRLARGLGLNTYRVVDNSLAV